MTRHEYFKTLFPSAKSNAFDCICCLCCYDLGLATECKVTKLSCKECWNSKMETHIPLNVAQSILDKFMKVW